METGVGVSKVVAILRRRSECNRPAGTCNPEPRVKLFREVLGYDYLGDWSERSNSNVEEACSLPTSRGWPTIL